MRREYIKKQFFEDCFFSYMKHFGMFDGGKLKGIADMINTSKIRIAFIDCAEFVIYKKGDKIYMGSSVHSINKFAF